MSNQDSSSSIAFLDLLTCGLGSMLLLFFIVSALTQQIDSANVSGENAGLQGEDKSVVMIYLSTTATRQLFKEGKSPFLELDGKEFAKPQSTTITSAESLFVFYASEELPLGTQLIAAISDNIPIEGFIADRFGSRTIDIAAIRKSGLIYQFGALPKDSK